jgi:hypothetical protein
MSRPLNFSFPSRRQFLVGSAVTTLSAATVALLAGRPTPLCREYHPLLRPASDAGTLNTALALEHEGINAYTLGAQSNLLQKPVLALESSFRMTTRLTATA